MLRAVTASALLLLAAAPPAGVLEVRSQAGVEVLWEGVSLGETDGRGRLVIRDIPPGEYSVALRKSGHRQYRTKVQIDGGETTLRRELELLEREPAADPAAARPRPGPTRSPEAAEPEPPVAAAPSPSPSSESRGRTTGGAASDSRTPEAAEAPPPEPAAAIGRNRVPGELRAAAPPSGDEDDESGTGGGPTRFLYLLLAAVLGAAILFMLRGPGRLLRPAVARPSAPVAAPVIEGELVADEPTATPEEEDSFLSDLRQREETISSATRFVDGRQVVEVEVTDVEIVDEET